MKNILIIIFVPTTFSCESTDVKEDAENGHPVAGNWHLSKIVSAWTGEEQTITNEQFYTFASDGTFSKTSGKKVGSGTYVLGNDQDYEFATLTFLKNTSLSESCSQGIESFRLENDDLLVGGSAPCDGPFLYYRRIEK